MNTTHWLMSARQSLLISLSSALLLLSLLACQPIAIDNQAQLLRQTFTSEYDQTQRQYFVYLPKGYHQSDTLWPVMLFLHGNGERGDGQAELDFVLSHGPLYEAWIQKRELPFVIIAPQLPMFDFDKQGLGYIDNRRLEDVPVRLKQGTVTRAAYCQSTQSMLRHSTITTMQDIEPLPPKGWETIENDLLSILNATTEQFKTDPEHIYLTGLSYGGFGTWYLASQHPKLFTAIAPVVAWGHPDMMSPIAKQDIPLWVFAGGRDSTINIEYFYPGLNTLEALGHSQVRFTVHEELEHDAWKRVYASEDLYRWFLSHKKTQH
ncbi:prolyl oligopeptidase family serine peptidase [Pseudoalteromonas ulvae]|nr:prolyl oligopeptidase family serine peptidase [Pseudoalteromonas ulvae]